MSFSPFAPIERDAIFLSSLIITPTLKATDQPSASTSIQQPALVHLRVIPPNGFSSSTKRDKLEPDTISYSNLAELIVNHSNQPGRVFGSLEELAETLASLISKKCQTSENNAKQQVREENCMEFDLVIELPKAIKFSGGLSISIHRPISSQVPESLESVTLDRISINQFSLGAIIGLLEHERLSKQEVVVNVMIWKSFGTTNIDVHGLSELISDTVTGSSFFTVEKLANSIATTILSTKGHQGSSKMIEKVKVRVEKPAAVPFALGAGVEVTLMS